MRNKQTQIPKLTKTPKQSGFIPNIATPASPWSLPTTPVETSIPDHTGHKPPSMPTPLKKELRDLPRHPPTPRDPFILDPIQKTNPIQDPSFRYTQTEPIIKTKLTGKPQSPKRKSSELLTIRNTEYTPSKNYFPLDITKFGQVDPAQFKFSKPTKDPRPKQQEPKKPETLYL